MKMYQLKCPACGGTIEIEKNRDCCFCSYCGTKVYVDDETHRVEITKNINCRKTYTDEATIRKIESDERIQEQKIVAAREKRKIKRWSALGTVLIMLACVIGLFVSFNGAKEASDRQEQELQAIVDEIMQDIEDGNFNEAYIKAEKIRYTENWSNEIKDKWDATRKEIIKQIKIAEREANKEKSGGMWWNPFD